MYSRTSILIGDECYAPGDEVEPSWFVSTVDISTEEVKVYNLLDVKEHNNFYANQVLVHNK